MKTQLPDFLKPFFTLYLFAVLAFMSSCSNTKYTASFQKSPSKAYPLAQVNPEQNDVQTPPEQIVADLEIADIIGEEINYEIPKDLTASLKELGISEKKSSKIEKRLLKLNEALEAAPDSRKEKLSFVEKMAVRKALKKADKILAASSIKDINDLDEAHKTQQMNNNVRTGLILLLAGILLGIFIPILGGIVAIVGIVFLIIGLLEM